MPETLAAEIEAEAQRRGLSKAHIIRERLGRTRKASGVPPSLKDIADLIGSIDDDLPTDLSARKKHYLRRWSCGKRRDPVAIWRGPLRRSSVDHDEQ